MASAIKDEFISGGYFHPFVYKAEHFTCSPSQMVAEVATKTMHSQLIEHKRLHKEPLQCQLRYIGPLGAGAYGEIFKVGQYSMRNVLQDTLILKSQYEFSDRDDEVFRNEEDALVKLNQKGVRHTPKLLSVIEDQFSFPSNFRAFLMPNYGVPLSEGLCNPSHSFTLFEIQSYIKQVLETLVDLEKVTFCHGDLKAENILVQDGHVTLIDWGTAYSVPDEIRGSFTTITCRAPEFFLNEGHFVIFDGSIDIWALGCLFHEMVTKRFIFPCKVEDSALMLADMVSVLGPPSAEVVDQHALGETYFTIEDSAVRYLFPTTVNTFKVINNFKECLKSKKATDEMVAGAVELLFKMLDWDPRKRIKPKVALAHPFFNDQSSVATVKK